MKTKEPKPLTWLQMFTLQFKCPVCDADTDEQCRTSFGIKFRYGKTHKQRIHRAGIAAIRRLDPKMSLPTMEAAE